MADVEVWKNAGAGSIWITRHDGQGKKSNETVKGGGTLKITPEDRELQSQLAASEEQDLFKNGRMVPVKLLDGSEIEAEVASNPNLKSESALVEMLGMQWKKFESEVGSITNLMTVERLRDLASSDEQSVTVKKMEIIDARIAELNPVQVQEAQTVTGPRVGGVFEGTSGN